MDAPARTARAPTFCQMMMHARWSSRVLTPLLIVLALPLPAADARPVVRAPAGYQVDRRATVARGLTHIRLRRGGRSGQVVNIARLAPRSKLRIQPVLSRGNRTGRGPLLERTSTLCRRARCLAAVNGDFFRGGTPVGGLVLDGAPVAPVRGSWVQAIFDEDRRLVARRLRIRATIMTTDLRKTKVERVDPRGKRWVSIFTAASGRRTPRGRSVEAVFRAVDPRGPARVGQTSIMRLVRVRDAWGRTPIPDDGLVLTGRNRKMRAVRSLVRRIRAQDARHVLVRLRSNPGVWDTIGGRPVIVRGGRSVVGRTRDSFVRSRHPRTLVGRARDGSTLLVTVDGRQRGRAGMSLREAARLMLRLGAVEAINLDGGGSTTFVTRGRVRNSPSDGRERPVAVALAVVRGSQGVAQPTTPRLRRVPLPASAEPSAPARSRAPSGALPAIVAAAEGPGSRAVAIGSAAASVATAVGLLGWARRRRRRHRPA